MGPRKRWAGVFLVLLAALYWPLTRRLEPVVREMWFRTVIKGLATDARGLSPPQGKMWLGASRPELPQSLHGIYALESTLGQPLSIVSFYQAWGDGSDHVFPAQVLGSLRKGGYLPMLTWEPWLSAFDRWNGAEPPAPLRIIAAGELDDYVRRWARGAARFGHPFFLRPGHEPTNPRYAWAPQLGSTPADYRAFWSRVRRIFREEGARNVAFVWTPFGLQEREWFPGAEQVDWVGFDIFNYGGLSETGTWLDFYTLTKLFYDVYRDLGPQLMVAETATTSAGGNKTDWVRDMFHTLAQNDFPKIRAVVLFDHPSGQTDGGLPVDWSLAEGEGTSELFKSQPALLAAFSRESEIQR